jgi:hypothetical protein
MLSVMFMGGLRYFSDFSANRLCATVRYRTRRGALYSVVALCTIVATARASGAALKWPGPIRAPDCVQTGVSSMNP